MAHTESAEAVRAERSFIRYSMGQPLLSRERERELAIAWREEGDSEALHLLTHSYLRLVIAIAAKFRNYGLPMNDLVQEGSIGLMQAAERFDPYREVRFSTYASWWIRSAIQDFVLRNWSIVRTGTTAAQKSLFFNLRRLRARIEEQSGQMLDEEGRQRIASELAVDINDVRMMEARLSGSDHSLNLAVGEDGEDEWQSFLPDERPDPEENTRQSHDVAVRHTWIAQALGELDQRERMIIEQRRLRDEGATLEELGRELGVSKERVRQLEHRALGKMRVAIASRTEAPRDLFLENV